jgi:hypothetical protein
MSPGRLDKHSQVRAHRLHRNVIWNHWRQIDRPPNGLVFPQKFLNNFSELLQYLLRNLWGLVAIILLLPALSIRSEAQVDGVALQEGGTTKGTGCAPFKLNSFGCRVSKSVRTYATNCSFCVEDRFTATTNDDFGYDTTNQNWHARNGRDGLIGLRGAADQCVQHLVIRNKVELTSTSCDRTVADPGGDPNSIQLSNGGSFVGTTRPLTTRKFADQSGNGTTPSGPNFNVLQYGHAVCSFSSGSCSGYPKSDGSCDTPSGTSNVDNGISGDRLPVWDTQSGKYKPQAGLPIVDVRSFSGSDWCAQVNAADAANSRRNVILSVPAAMSGMTPCMTSISLSTGHQLSFGTGTFSLGTQKRRTGIVIGHAVNNVAVTGQGIGKTILQYKSYVVPLGQGGNAFPWGSAIGLGTVKQCSAPSDANNNIHIEGITFVDLNTGSALSSTHAPSAIDGACANNVIIEGNEFTDIKGNAAITVTGSYGGGGGDTYYDRNNIFDGTVAGGGAEFNADNSANWTHYYVLDNTISYYPCGIGVSHAFQGIVSGNTLDMTLKAARGACPAIGLGSSDDTVGYLEATNNTIILGTRSSPVGIGMYPKDITGNYEMAVIGNIIHQVSRSTVTGIYINGTSAGHNPPREIVRHNVVTANYPTTVTGVLGNVEVSDNEFDGASDNIDIFNCASFAVSIQPGSVVKVFNNRRPGHGGVALRSCTNSTFASTRFQEWNNTQGGDPSSYYGGYVGQPARVIWKPGTIPAGSSTSTQTTTVNGAIVGDEVKIVLDSSTTALPAGVFATGYVSAANTVLWKIVNTTTSPITINGGRQITTYISVDRPPNDGFVPDFTNIKAANAAALNAPNSAAVQDRKSPPPTLGDGQAGEEERPRRPHGIPSSASGSERDDAGSDADGGNGCGPMYGNCRGLRQSLIGSADSTQLCVSFGRL